MAKIFFEIETILTPCDRYGNANGDIDINTQVEDDKHAATVTVEPPYSSWFVVNDASEKKIITLHDDSIEVVFSGEDVCRRSYPTFCDQENNDAVCNVADVLIRDINGDVICSNEELAMWCDILDSENTDSRVCEISTAIMEEI